MTDWDGVFLDADNAVLDTTGPGDPDTPDQPDRDLDLTAATWDEQNLYLFWRRTTSGTRAVTMFAYIDRDGDGVMRSGDVVAIMGFSNSGYQPNPNSSNVVYYSAHNSSSSDVMRGDGHTMPGQARPGQNRVPGAVYSGAMDSSGLRFEASVSWAALGVPAGSPISIQFAVGNGSQSPTHIEDNAGPSGGLSFARPAVSLSPALTTAGGVPGTVVTHSYTITNSGNLPQTYTLGTSSLAGWNASTWVAGAPATSVTLAPGSSVPVNLRVAIPLGTAQGVAATTALAVTSTTHASVVARATAHTVAGALTLTPNHSASIHSGAAIDYRHTVANNTGASAVVNLSATSSLGWPVELYLSDAITPVNSLTLAAGASVDVVARVRVPAGTAHGTQDVTAVRAVLATDPTILGAAQDATTVRPELEITPNLESVGGPGTAVSYTHRVTNNAAAARSINLSVRSSSGWPVSLFAADGVTPISSVTLGPYGASVDIVARVQIPAGASEAATDIMTVTASHGSFSASVTDTTRVRRLATYDGPGFGSVATNFNPGDTVYARGMGLTGFSQVRFRWINASGTVVHTSLPVGVNTLQTAHSFYTLPADATHGTWNLVLLNSSNNAEITRVTFNVSPAARITSLSASNAPGLGDMVHVSSTAANNGAQSISGSTMTYVIWWDTDGNGVFGAGDLFIDSSGASRVYDGSAPVSTRTTTGITVPAGATWTEPQPWAISNTGFPNQGTYRVTATWRTTSGMLIDTRTTEFYSIPALGWPLFALTLLIGVVFMWHSRHRMTPALAKASAP